MFKRFDSLVKQLNIWIAVSLVLCAAFYYGASTLAINIASDYLASDSYNSRVTAKVADRLQEYVTDNDISSSDYEKIDEFTADYSFIYVYKDNIMVYGSFYSEEEVKENQFEEAEYEDYYVYQVEFSDACCDVAIYDYSGTRWYYVIRIIAFAVSAILFFVLMILGMRRNIRRLEKLDKEIHILESGNLDYQISVEGNNEISRLAASTENMRTAFKDRVQEMIDMEEASNNLVTEMAHDIRTPITSLQMYLEFCEDEINTLDGADELRDYIRKARENVEFIKTFSNDTFELFLINKSKVYAIESVSFRDGVYEEISALAEYLHNYGFTIESQLENSDFEIAFNAEAFGRIISNITKNMERYADSSAPIIIKAYRTLDEVNLVFINGIRHDCTEEGTGLGRKIMERLMNTIGGECITTAGDDTYEVRLVFKVTKEMTNGIQ